MSYLKSHYPCFVFTVENVKEVLKLIVEQKGVLVPIGELTVYLDGVTVTEQEELAPLTNGNAANGNSELSTYSVGVADCGMAIFIYCKGKRKKHPLSLLNNCLCKLHLDQ